MLCIKCNFSFHVVMDNKYKTNQTLYQEAVDLKEQGNHFFKLSEFTKAKRKYHYALFLTRAISSRDTVGKSMSFLQNSVDNDLKYHEHENFKKSVESLEADCNRNLAMTLMKEGRWMKGLEYSQKALDFNENDEKSLYRYSNCALKLGMLDESKLASEKLIELQPGKHIYEQTHRKILQECKKESENGKKIYQKMFQGT